MIDAIGKQVPNVTQLINEYAQIVNTYLQERLDKESQDENVINAFKSFLKQIPEFLEKDINEKVNLKYGAKLINDWVYEDHGYLTNKFYNVPDGVLDALFNGYLLDGNRFSSKINVSFKLKDSSGDTVTATFRIQINLRNKDYIQITEITDIYDYE